LRRELFPQKFRVAAAESLNRFEYHAMLGILPDMTGQIAHYRGFARIDASAYAKRAKGFALQLKHSLHFASSRHEILMMAIFLL
jgi:hypothetical protein